MKFRFEIFNAKYLFTILLPFFSTTSIHNVYAQFTHVSRHPGASEPIQNGSLDKTDYQKVVSNFGRV